MFLKTLLFIQLSFCTSIFAFPNPNTDTPQLPKRDDVSALARKWQKNCQDKGYSDLEVEAWDSYYQLAKYAQLWKADAAYQSTADLWFGKDSNKAYGRIMNTFNNLVKWHESQYWVPKPVEDAYFEVFCAEDGPDGLPPKPDELGPDDVWDGSYCETSGAWAFSYRLDRWWWDAQRFYTIICKKSWDKRYSLAAVNDAIQRGGGKNKVDMNFLYDFLRAHTWLHEFTHHDIVTNPNQPVKDMYIKGAQWPYKPAFCYGPDASAALANWYGSTTPVSDADGGYNGEFGTAINADNYAMFAMSVYFQETLSRQAPYEPKDPRYKDIPKRFVDPVPNHPGLFNASALSGDDPDVYNNSNNAITRTLIMPTPALLVSVKDKALCINESTPDPFQQTFARSDAINNINAFCQDSFKWDFQIVPPISYGDGKTPAGQKKAMQFDNSVSSSDRTVKNGIWLNVRFFDEECMGSTAFAQGSSSDDKTAYCTNHFMSILDGCQNDTQTAKYGGALQTDCLYYQIQGRTANTTNNYIMKQPGALICNPTDATIVPDLAGTCTCSYANFNAIDTFTMPPSGNCKDVDPKNLYVPK